MVDTITLKFYSHPFRSKLDNAGVTTMITIVVGGAIQRFISQYRAQLYLSEASQGFKILLISIGILTSIPMFRLGLWAKKKATFHLSEYLKQHPVPEEVKDVNVINKVIDKASSSSVLILVSILGGGAFTIIMFNRFLSYSNLITYSWGVLSIMMFSLISVGLKNVIFNLGLKPLKPSGDQKKLADFNHPNEQPIITGVDSSDSSRNNY